MAVSWKDQYHDATKILAASDKRIIQKTDPGFIKGDSIADRLECDSQAEVNAFFEDIFLTDATWDVANTNFDYKALKVTFPAGADTAEFVRKNVSGADWLPGWHNLKCSMWFKMDTTVLAATGYLYLNVQGKNDNGSLGPGFRLAIDLSENATNFVIYDNITGTYVDSGMALPSNGQWAKLEIEFRDEKVYYNVDNPDVGDAQTSYVIHNFINATAPVFFRVKMASAAGGDLYMDNFEIETHLEQNDDDTNYALHQHEFKTIEITNANWYQWDKIKLTKEKVALTDEKFISVSVLDSSDDSVITGYENLVDDEIDISGVTVDAIKLYIKFWSVNSYESPILKETEVTYFVTGGEVTLAVTANSYNDDITPPIATKTGYRITFEATAETPSDPDTEVIAYWFDFGDGLNSGWITNNVVNHVYNKHSQNVSEAGADKEWQARVKVKLSDGTVESITGWSNEIDVNVVNSRPVARMWATPSVVRMSGAGPDASVTLFGSDSFDQDDNGNISTSGGYLFDVGDGTPMAYQVEDYITHVYTVAGTYVVGLNVKDDLGSVSEKFTMRIRILDALSPTIISFDRLPTQADFDYSAELQVTPTIAGGYPSVNPTTRIDQMLKINGNAHLVETDFALMKQYTLNNTLVSFQYNDLDGVQQTFSGYIRSFRGKRSGGFIDDVPWSAIVQYVDV